jgi:hypothetical protein
MWIAVDVSPYPVSPTSTFVSRRNFRASRSLHRFFYTSACIHAVYFVMRLESLESCYQYNSLTLPCRRGGSHANLEASIASAATRR